MDAIRRGYKVITSGKFNKSNSLIYRFDGFNTNQGTDQLAVGLLAQLVEHCTGQYCRGRVFKSHTDLNFFQALFPLLHITTRITLIGFMK